MEITSKFTSPGILLLLTLVIGWWVSSAGRPYNGLLFNIHKLVALSAVIVGVIQFSKTLKSGDPQTLIVALLVVATLCVVALFASGALMSMDKLDYTLTLTIHRIALVALPLIVVLVVYLLQKGL